MMPHEYEIHRLYSLIHNLTIFRSDDGVLVETNSCRNIPKHQSDADKNILCDNVWDKNNTTYFIVH